MSADRSQVVVADLTPERIEEWRECAQRYESGMADELASLVLYEILPLLSESSEREKELREALLEAKRYVCQTFPDETNRLEICRMVCEALAASPSEKPGSEGLPESSTGARQTTWSGQPGGEEEA